MLEVWWNWQDNLLYVRGWDVQCLWWCWADILISVAYGVHFICWILVQYLSEGVVDSIYLNVDLPGNQGVIRAIFVQYNFHQYHHDCQVQYYLVQAAECSQPRTICNGYEWIQILISRTGVIFNCTNSSLSYNVVCMYVCSPHRPCTAIQITFMFLCGDSSTL